MSAVTSAPSANARGSATSASRERVLCICYLMRVPFSSQQIKAIATVAAASALAGSGLAVAAFGSSSGDSAITSVYPVAHPRGLLVTTGGWAYCLQIQRLA